MSENSLQAYQYVFSQYAFQVDKEVPVCHTGPYRPTSSPVTKVVENVLKHVSFRFTFLLKFEFAIVYSSAVIGNQLY